MGGEALALEAPVNPRKVIGSGCVPPGVEALTGVVDPPGVADPPGDKVSVVARPPVVVFLSGDVLGTLGSVCSIPSRSRSGSSGGGGRGMALALPVRATVAAKAMRALSCAG